MFLLKACQVEYSYAGILAFAPLVSIIFSNQLVIGQMKMHSGNEWLIATTYGSKEVYKRRQLWEDLQTFTNSCTPCIIGGDFNCILSQEEKIGGKRFIFSQGPQDMQRFMKSYDFHDVGIIGPKYTWCNNKKGGARILERLDWCLLNSAALKTLQPAAVHHLGRIASDHCPIVINICNPGFKKCRRLQFEEVWTSYPVSKGIVANSWAKPAGGDDVQKLNLKFKRVLKALFHWSKAKHANLNSLKEELKVEILVLQEEEANSGGLSEDKFFLLRYKINEFNSTLGRLSSWWRQRAKVKWYKESDTNFEYFNSVASARRNSNHIRQIKSSDGNLTEDQNCIEEIISKFLKKKWKFRRCSLNGWPNFSKSIDETDKDRLVANFSEEELENVISHLESNISSGIDGVGGVIRDYKGRFLFAFGFKSIHWDISELELEALKALKNITQEWMYQAKGIIIEWDNYNVMKHIQGIFKEGPTVSNNLELLDFLFLRSFNQVIFQFVNRTSNKLADCCANHARLGDFWWNNLIINNVPPMFFKILKEECDNLIFV
ncbi:uncharacterized protein LOC110098176 [Dendrobium catenatum]|uniref:uncharacterized protein LOC110098176 n=1 Tax=Dendrobium catenatum TaxID=906689 RepID=UPI00109F4188|nr:uncharacterized protein LOC110098176 [Dendrobium catenatum]